MYIAQPTPLSILKKILHLDYQQDMVVMLLVCEKNAAHVPAIITTLQEENIRFFGGIFPGLIHGSKHYKEGVLITLLPTFIQPFLIKGLNTTNIQLPQFSELPFLLNSNTKKYLTIVLVDGLASNISLFLSKLFNRFGKMVSYFGGGAGSLSLQQMPCVFSNEGLFQNAAVVAFIDLHANMGVKHGWQQLEGPFIATKTNKNVVQELNWQNAFEVYSEVVETQAKQELDADNFFEIAKSYPLGIYRKGEEDIVRDPILVNDQKELVCVGEVPQNTVLNILKGNKNSLIGAAQEAASNCFANAPKNVKYGMTMDCISRVLFLENDFEKELAAVNSVFQNYDPKLILHGALTLGEIAANSSGFLKFFNKTIVTTALYE